MARGGAFIIVYCNSYTRDLLGYCDNLYFETFSPLTGPISVALYIQVTSVKERVKQIVNMVRDRSDVQVHLIKEEGGKHIL